MAAPYIALAVALAVFFAGALAAAAKTAADLMPSEDAELLRRAAESVSAEGPETGDPMEAEELSGLAADLVAAGYELSPGEWLTRQYGFAALAAMAAAAVAGSAGSIAIAPVAAAAAALAVVVGFKSAIGRGKKKSAMKLEKQIANLELQMAENAKSGLTALSSLAACTEQAQQPLKRHLVRVYNQVTYGDMRLSEALREMAERAGSEDARLLAVSVAIHEQSGSSLADALTFLHDSVSEKLRMRDLLRSELSYTEFTKKLVAATPWVLFLALSFAPFLAMDGFWDFYSTNPIGWGILAVSAVAELGLIKLMDKMSDIDMD